MPMQLRVLPKNSEPLMETGVFQNRPTHGDKNYKKHIIIENNLKQRTFSNRGIFRICHCKNKTVPLTMPNMGASVVTQIS